jgi:hypothetical protein
MCVKDVYSGEVTSLQQIRGETLKLRLNYGRYEYVGAHMQEAEARIGFMPVPIETYTQNIKYKPLFES